MKKTEYLYKSLLNSLGVVLYVSTLAWSLFNIGPVFDDNKPSFLGPVVILLLFIVSASITGLLVLGKPIFLYLENKKKEAFIFLFCTLGWLVFFIALALVGILLT